jgi:glutaredoxin 3
MHAQNLILASGRATGPGNIKHQSTKMPEVQIYTRTPCSYCTRARSLLQRKGVEYTEIPVDHDPAQQQQMFERSRRHTVPQVFIDDRHVGGYSDLAALDSCGELDPLLGR